MIVNILMFVTVYPLNFIFYFIFRSQYQYENGCLFAVDMSPEWIKEDEVKAVVEKFKKEMRNYFLFLAIVPFSCLFTKYFSIQLTIWTFWMLAVIILLCLPLVHANNALKKWKREHFLYEDVEVERRVELKSIGKIRRVKFLPFFVPNVLTFLGAVVPVMARLLYPNLNKIVELSSVSGLCICMWLCGLALTAGAVWMDRQPVTVISRDSDINLNYTRAKKNAWKNFWLAVLWVNAAFVGVILTAAFLIPDTGKMILAGTVGYAVLTLVLSFPLMYQLQRIEAAYQKKRELNENANDDRHWIGGILYYNPADRRTMVPKKVGIGTTTNLATPAGKAFEIFAILCLVIAVPAMCIWLIMLEFTPIRLQVENETLYAKHLNVEYEIDVKDIENLETITELPTWSKSSGTAMDTLEEGTFFIRNVGKCEVFLNPENTEFLHFSVNGTDYYMSGYDDTQTEEIYQLLNYK